LDKAYWIGYRISLQGRNLLLPWVKSTIFGQWHKLYIRTLKSRIYHSHMFADPTCVMQRSHFPEQFPDVNEFIVGMKFLAQEVRWRGWPIDNVKHARVK
jgi:hypothetical protein